MWGVLVDGFIQLEKVYFYFSFNFFAGIMVWYQKFEYAIAHWFQKAAEHVFGCVLCAPGCFSLFRASALMDDNVIHKYTTTATEPRHFVQYDQGEDRWLSTLLLKQAEFYFFKLFF